MAKSGTVSIKIEAATGVRVLAGLAAFAIFALAARFCIGLGVVWVVLTMIEYALIPE